MTEPQDPQANEVERRQAQVVEDESVDRSGKVPLTARLLLHDSLTARRAAGIIAVFTVVITVAGGVLERVLDHQEYPTIGRGLWFALQTVTTVGYGDVTPEQSVGRFIATVVMLTGIGFLAVVTASVTASLVESSRRRFTAQSEADERGSSTRSSTDWRGSKRHSSSRRLGGHPMRPADEPGSITPGTSDEPPESALAAPARIRPRGAASDECSPGRVSCGGSSIATPSTSPSDSRCTRPVGSAIRRGNGLESVRSARPDTPVAKIAEELRTQSAHVARIDGAISGTPFFIALVPGYLTYLQQEMRMTLRTAALYGRDPRSLRTSAEMLALRGVHPDVEAAEAALISVRDKGTPRSSGTAAIVAHMGSQRLPAAHLRRLHVPVGRQRRHRHAWQGQGGVRCPAGRGDLGDDLGAPAHLHDRDGLGM